MALILAFLAGCSSAPRSEVLYGASPEPMVMSKSMKDDAQYEEAGAPPPPAPLMAMDAPPEPVPVVQMNAPSTPRMVFHDGRAQLKSLEPQVTLDTATAMAIRLGGYVEARNAGHLVLRIPVDKFLDNFENFVALGTLVTKSMTSEDITDQYADTELRLRIAKTTLERLKILLAQSTDASEKLSLLQDIQRVSQQIELDEAHKRELGKKAAFSRLTLDVEPFVFAAENEEPIAAFRWIQSLNPLRANESFDNDALTLLVPKDFIDLQLKDDEKPWAAAASDGAEIWARTRDNDPKGDAAFWIETLRLRLAKPFKTIEVVDAGVWKVLLMTSFDHTPYTWMVAVRVDKNDLRVAEAFFPTPQSLAAHRDAVLEVLKGELP